MYSSVWDSGRVTASSWVISTGQQQYGASLCLNQLRGQWEIWQLRLDTEIMMQTLPSLKWALVMILHIPRQVCLYLLKTLWLFLTTTTSLCRTWGTEKSLCYSFISSSYFIKFCVFMAYKTGKERALQSMWLTPPSLLVTTFIICFCFECKHGILDRNTGSWPFIGFTTGKTISRLPCPIIQTMNTSYSVKTAGVSFHTELMQSLNKQIIHTGWNTYNFHTFHIFPFSGN